MAGIANHLGAKQGKKKIKWCPKIDFDLTFDREPGHEESIGMFVFNFDQKVDVTPPPTPLFRGQNQFFLGDVFIFCLDFFDTLDGTS